MNNFIIADPMTSLGPCFLRRQRHHQVALGKETLRENCFLCGLGWPSSAGAECRDFLCFIYVVLGTQHWIPNSILISDA